MRRSVIRWLVVLAIIAITGITITQVYWFKKAFDVRNQEFNRSVTLALREVANGILSYNDKITPVAIPVRQLSSNYFVVDMNSEINPYLLEGLIDKELQMKNIEMQYECIVFDCTSQQYKKSYVGTSKFKNLSAYSNFKFPKWNNGTNYFGVYFINKSGALVSNMKIWMFSTIVLIVVIVFFAYSLFIILKQRRLSEVQREFINNMTHEFKTPLSTIHISSEVLSNPGISGQPNKIKTYADIIGEESSRLRGQVERVLHIATIDKDVQKLKVESIDIHDTIKSIVESFNLVIQKNNIKIQLVLAATNYYVEGDAFHIKNAIYNLIDNAIKYGDGSDEIWISTENAGNQLNINVRDNGPGIPRNEIKRIFDKFYRVSSGDVHNVKGFGLGLNYVKKVASMHKGKVTVQSKMNIGSTFTLSLPIKPMSLYS